MRALLLLAVLLVAGCVAPEAVEPAATTEPEAAPPATPTPSAAAPAAKPAAPASSANATSAAAPNETANETATTPLVVPIETEGMIDASVLVCPPCTGMRSVGLIELEKKGTLQGYSLTLTWEAATPASETLRLGIERNRGEEDAEYVFVDGPSPLVLEGADLAADAEDVITIFVWRPPVTSDAVTVYAGAPQEYAVTGTVTLLVEPSA